VCWRSPCFTKLDVIALCESFAQVLCHWMFLFSATYPDRIALPVFISICGLGLLILEITIHDSYVVCNIGEEVDYGRTSKLQTLWGQTEVLGCSLYAWRLVAFKIPNWRHYSRNMFLKLWDGNLSWDSLQTGITITINWNLVMWFTFWVSNPRQKLHIGRILR
jgi:hypothetical protein